MKICTVAVQLAAALAASVVLSTAVLADDCPACGTVSVSVAGSQGEVIRGGAYLALRAKGGSFREPVAETLSDSSPPLAAWLVQPGTYEAVCFARGFGFSVLLPLRFAAVKPPASRALSWRC